MGSYMTSLRIVGVDAGKQAGVAVIENQELKSWAVDLSKLGTWKVGYRRGTHVWVERGGWVSQSNAFHLGVHTGVLLEKLGLFGAKVNWVLPKVWKKLVLGNGNASKQDIMDWAVSQGFAPETQDQADAIAIAHYGYYKGLKS